MSPVDASVLHKAVEHILLAGKQPGKAAALIIEGVPHGEEQELNEHPHHLDECELAVRTLDLADHFELYGEALHHCCYSSVSPNWRHCV